MIPSDDPERRTAALEWRFGAFVDLALSWKARSGFQVNDHLIWRIVRRKFGSQPADFRRVLTLPLCLLARTRPRAKRRTTAMFLAPDPVRYRDRSSPKVTSRSQCMLSTPQWPRAPWARRSISRVVE